MNTLTLSFGGRDCELQATTRHFVAFTREDDQLQRALDQPEWTERVAPVSRFLNSGTVVEERESGCFGDLKRMVQDLPGDSSVRRVYKLPSGHECAFSNRLFIGLKHGVDLQQLVASKNVELIEQVNEREAVIGCEEANVQAAIQDLQVLEGVDYVEPDLVFFSKTSPIVLEDELRQSDPLLSQQWALDKIAAPAAWDLVAASQSVKVAIVDVGVDGEHPDLKVASAFNSLTGEDVQAPASWEYHGTLCAGVALAEPGNEVGLRGVAGGCHLSAIKAAEQSDDSPQWIWTTDSARRAFEWARKNGVDVISCSWEASWDGDLPSTAVNNEIERARTLGRDGKGCVIVFSAGNYHKPDTSGSVTYPATLPGVLTVSATNAHDEFKTRTSSDGDSRWGSCSGQEVDIGAPGVKVYTTDIHGDGGVVPNLVPGDNNDYFQSGGTSAAAPIVAACAALVLSANGNLTEQEVREILMQTADKVGDEPYTDGRNDQLGFGRVNARAAVEEALRRKC